jgi:hypothetical protein
MLKSNKPSISFNHNLIVTMVMMHNTRVSCIRKYGSRVITMVKDFPRLVNEVSDVRFAYDKGGIVQALKSLHILGKYSNELHEFATFCNGQVCNLFADNKNSGFLDTGSEIYTSTYEHTYKTVTGLTLPAASAISSAAAALAVYDGHYADAVNELFANTDFGSREINVFEVAETAQAVSVASSDQKIEFNRILDGVK